MLAADKLLLQSNVKQRAIQLREKELNLFNDKCAACARVAPYLRFCATSRISAPLALNAYPSSCAQLQCGRHSECRARGLCDDLVRRDRSAAQRLLRPEGATTPSEGGDRAHC